MEPATVLTTRDSYERTVLLNHFLPRIRSNEALDRSLVSFQANRTIPYYNWFKYREGFSANLKVELSRQAIFAEIGTELQGTWANLVGQGAAKAVEDLLA